MAEGCRPSQEYLDPLVLSHVRSSLLGRAYLNRKLQSCHVNDFYQSASSLLLLLPWLLVCVSWHGPDYVAVWLLVWQTSRPVSGSATMAAVNRRWRRWPSLFACLAVNALVAGVVSTAVAGMYNYKTSSVVQLTSDNFHSMVLDSKETWYAEGALRLALCVTALLYCFKQMVTRVPRRSVSGGCIR